MTTVALVPAFRRSDRVGATVAALLPLVDEVVVIDDGSDDGGATIDSARLTGATVVALPLNRGKGGALAAGVAATPDADVYLLVDADTAETAAASVSLLAAVREGADLAIGVLPPANGRGGFGTVRNVAAWGIRRGCGFVAAAPLSGQRAVRAPLLRSMELAERFGVEVGMTIDAVRGGAHVVEIPVGMDHAHTGRTVAGFSHRAAQGWDLLRALWPRLLSEPTRLVVLVGLAVLAVAVLAMNAAAGVPMGTPLSAVDHVVLVAAPPTLRLSDLADPTRAELVALAGFRGAVAAVNVDVPGRNSWSMWATVSAGAKVAARAPNGVPDANEPFLVQDRPLGQGRLGDALHRAGRTTAFVGTQPTSPVRLAVADGAGRIDLAATAGSLGVAGLVNQTRTDLTRGAAVVAVDASELDPLGFEQFLAGLRSVGQDRRLLLMVTPVDLSEPFGLRPFLASGPGAPAGRLVSPSTHRDGLMLLSDVAPTVLASLGVPKPSEMIGQPLRRLARPPDVAGLVQADRLARQRDTVWDPALLVVVPLHLLAYGLAWRRRQTEAGVGRSARGERALAQLALGLLAWPLATWLVRAIPGSGSFGRGAALLALAADALVVAAAWRLGRRRGVAAATVVLGATILLITLDLGLGGPLQVSSAFGGAAHTTGRFTGLGNPAFALYAVAGLLAVAGARRRAPWMVALLVLVALVDALPSLGGDVGGALTLVPIAALTVAALWDRLRWRTVVLAGLATAAVLGVALAADLSRPADSQTHLARFVTGGGRSSSIGGKLAQNLETYVSIPPLVLVVAIAAGLSFLLWRGRFQALLPAGSVARIGMAGALGVALVGNLLNDSGPIVTLLAMSVIGPWLVLRSVASKASSS